MHPKVGLPRPLLVLFTGMYHNYCYSAEYMATSYDYTQFNFLVFYPRTICADLSSLAKPFQLVGHQAPALSSDTDHCHLARRCDSIIWAIIQYPLQWITGRYALSLPLFTPPPTTSYSQRQKSLRYTWENLGFDLMEFESSTPLHSPDYPFNLRA